MAMHGVNLGGWLVLEKWMTPTLFAGTDAIDEYTFMQTPDARTKLRDHQKNFIREADFKWMNQHGIEAVRIPVGYWVLEGDDPYVAGIGRLDWAFSMAKKYDLQVLLCLHGAPGSQNGHDHSGRVGKALWYRDKANRERTVDVLMQLATRYRDHPQFWGLELLNEPLVGVFQWKLRRFYNDAYQHLMHIVKPSTRIVFHDAFTPRLLSGAIWEDDAHRPTMDIHWYHFTYLGHKWTPIRWYWQIVAWHGRLIDALLHWQGVVIGEWSAVISGDRLKSIDTTQHILLQREHFERQLRAYEQADAWFYWTYKTEKPGIWDFRSRIEEGWIELKNQG